MRLSKLVSFSNALCIQGNHYLEDYSLLRRANQGLWDLFGSCTKHQRSHLCLQAGARLLDKETWQTKT